MKIIKIELKKAFTGSRFWLAFCIGQFLGISSILTVYRSWLGQRDYIQYWEDRFPVRQAYTLYNVWILNEQLSIGRTLFFFWLPFLAAFPFAASYYQEEKKKQLRLVLVRTGRREYFRAVMRKSLPPVSDTRTSMWPGSGRSIRSVRNPAEALPLF